MKGEREREREEEREKECMCVCMYVFGEEKNLEVYSKGFRESLKRNFRIFVLRGWLLGIGLVLTSHFIMKLFR